MLTQSQRNRLQPLLEKPWSGLLNYFRSLKAEWDVLEGLGYVTSRLLPNGRDNSIEIWEYTITEAGRAALLERKDGSHA